MHTTHVELCRHIVLLQISELHTKVMELEAEKLVLSDQLEEMKQTQGVVSLCCID